MATIRTPKEVYDFWFVRCGRELWFGATPDLDAEISTVFRDTHLALAADVGAEWRADAESRLAAVIVLDQFPRNIYRGTPLAVATDGLALREAKLALASGADRVVETACRTFFYLPFEHAEDLGEQERSVALFTALGDEEYLDYAIRHRDVIAAYGRFPHRNAMLGRESTAGERDYLSKPGAGF
ncbi:DUF924 domain-containing protein [Rhizobium leguminosarum]|uniref:DUF924 family protein n=1 Tax=Rhizobium leguminosarum TaxID=384 RepID=UPI000DE1B08F|nr:DUF924 family protein [Rhizobium leguminosarum]MBY5900928.1 DUF924 domain-containing protein [Rhizobium leguminosarum]MBY5907130.1 DUF924 domain-containing protein [Rhizobium leguminosarum]NKJ95058.1 DUF924 family protein [Rhizobium leguminosarum bv. viciae]